MIWHWRPSLPHWAVGSWAARRPLHTVWNIYLFHEHPDLSCCWTNQRTLFGWVTVAHTVTHLEHTLNLPAAKSPHRSCMFELGWLMSGKLGSWDQESAPCGQIEEVRWLGTGCHDPPWPSENNLRDNQKIKNSTEIKKRLPINSEMFKIRKSSIWRVSEKPHFQSSKSGEWEFPHVSSKKSPGVQCFNSEQL